MNVFRISAALGAILAGSFAAAQEPRKPAMQPVQRAADLKAIQEAGAAFVRAYNAGDARAVAALFTEDAEVINEEGQVIQGRGAVAALFGATFAAHPGDTMVLDEISLRFLGADAAKEEGRARIMPGGARPGTGTGTATATPKAVRGQPGDLPGVPQINRYTVLYVRQDGRWLQSSVREHADRQVSPHQRLEPLAWLLGEWVDEGSSSVVHTSTRWSDDGNFLLRDFTIQIAGQPALRGTQRIGWDPLTRQITSWVFDSDGGHAIALWAQDGARWVVKSSGVLRDGRTTTVTQVYTVESPHLVRWKSVDRTIGDRTEPDSAELVMVPRPPRPR